MGILSRIWSRLVTKIIGRPPGKIKKKWVFKTKSSILNSATIADIDGDGRKEILFGTKDGSLYALSDRGEIKWGASLKISMGKVKAMFMEKATVNSILASPTIAEHNGKKIVIACSASGLVSAFYGDGRPCWKFRAKGTIFGAPLYTGKEIIFGASDKHLYSLSTKGKVLWKYKAKSAITSPPALYDEKPKLIIFGTENGNIKAVSKKGRFRWKFKTGSKVSAKPIISDIFNDKQKRIIVGSTDKSLYLLDKFGKCQWEYKTHGEIFSEVTLADVDQDKDKEIFFGTGDDTVYALAPNSQKIWSYETDFWVVAPPIVTDIDNDGASEVVVGSYDKSLYILEGKGAFALNYMPGLSIIANQPGHFTPFIISQPGELVGKKLWKLRLGSMITGLSLLEKKDTQKQLIISTKGGKLFSVCHEK